MKKIVGIVNYNTGNIFKLENTLKKIGLKVKIISNSRDLNLCDKIILPGVGTYNIASKFLKKKKLNIAIKNFIKQKKPLLAICLGFQLLFSKSQEADNLSGINIFSGNVKNLNNILKSTKIPNIGWHKVYFSKNSSKNLKKLSGEKFYFAHSYYCDFKTKLPASYIKIENKKILTSLNTNNIYAYQFHPEMSGNSGIEILKYFGEL